MVPGLLDHLFRKGMVEEAGQVIRKAPGDVGRGIGGDRHGSAPGAAGGLHQAPLPP
jgi:hypothetical protein